MIVYFKKIKDENISVIDTALDINDLFSRNKFTISNTDDEINIFYEGDESDIEDLNKIILRLFKKNKISIGDTEGFNNEIISEIISFIDTEIQKENFDISPKKIISKYIPTEVIKNNALLFLNCLVDESDHLEIFLSSEFNTNHTQDSSIIIKFDNEAASYNFFESLKLDTIDFHIKNDESILITKKWSTKIMKLIKFKLMILKESTPTILLTNSSKVVRVDNVTKTLNSIEVCNILNISRQTLSYWRNNNMIKFKKYSDRKYTYSTEQVYNILDKLLLEQQILPKRITPQQNAKPKIVNTEKKESKLDRLKKSFDLNLITTADEAVIDVVTEINYEEKISEWVSLFSYRIPVHKFTNQHFFLNFGNIGFTSSPQVMINDNFQLVDFIKGTIIKNTPKELFEYFEELKESGKEPRIDTSKKIYPGYSKFYLRKLN